MDAQQLDVIIRVAGATSLLLLVAACIGDRRTPDATTFFTPLAICLCGFLIGNTPDSALRLTGLVAGVAHLLSGYAAVFLWWFCLASFDRTFKPRGPVLAVGLAWLLIASADRGLFGRALADRGLSWLLVAIGFGMSVHLGWRLVRDREDDLLEKRRAARLPVAIFLAGQLLLDLIVDVVFGLDWRPRGFAIAQNAAILASALLLLARLAPARASPSPRADTEARTIVAERASTDAEGKLVERLRTLIEVERVHLDPHMTFEDFVQRMGASERVVRRLINRHLGHDHFRKFLNTYRVAEARRLMADPRRTNDKLITIAMDSGFASLASFNRVFRAAEACAPSDYRKNLRGVGNVDGVAAADVGIRTLGHRVGAGF
jgi:AraC-like DNA-binding protein